MLRNLFAIVIILVGLNPIGVFAQEIGKPSEDFTVVKNLQNEWLVYDQDLENYVPYILNTRFDSPTASFFVNLNQYQNYSLVLCLQKESAVFVEKSLSIYQEDEDCVELSLDSLQRLYGNRNLFITIFNENFNTDKTQALLVSGKRGVEELSQSEKTFEVLERQKGDFRSFFIIAIITLSLLYVVFMRVFPKNFSENLSLYRLFNLQKRELMSFSSRPLYFLNLIFLLIHCLTFSFVLIVLSYFVEQLPDFYQMVRGEGVLGFITNWVFLGLLLILSFAAKYVLVSFIASIFSLKQLDDVHFVIYTGLSKIFFLLLVAFIAVLFMAFKVSSTFIYLNVAYGIIGFFVLRAFFIFVKLAQTTRFRNIYLISYLCTTEIIPLLFGVKYFVNQ